MSKSPLSKFADKVYQLDYKDSRGTYWRGEFMFKPEMTRREAFQADARRRYIIGGTPTGTEPPSALQAEAYMLGILSVRITDCPTWWIDADNGLDLPDPAIVMAVYDLLIQMDEEIAQQLNEKAEEATNKVKSES